MTIQPIIDRLRELHAASTQGEWTAHPNKRFWILLPNGDRVDNRDADAAFVAAAHNQLPEVLAELERLHLATGMDIAYEQFQILKRENTELKQRIDKQERALAFVRSQLNCMNGGDAVRASLEKLLEDGK